MNIPESREQFKEEISSDRSGGGELLVMLLSFHGIPASAQQIHHEFGTQTGEVTPVKMVLAARQFGLKSKLLRVRSVEKLKRLPGPMIAVMADGSYVIIAKIHGERALIQRPASPPEEIMLSDFGREWSGSVILATKRSTLGIKEIRFGLAWFMPVLAKYKRLFTEVLVASFFLQLFGLITPLFFQVIIDKVLVHKGLTTLDVLVIGLAGITIFEVTLGFLRTYLFSHTTSRVDVQLGSQLYRHLLSLPIAYFETRPTGQTVARVRELDTVRDFITSSALTVVLDLFFTFVFFAVMWLFSPTLTLVVMAAIPAYVLLSVVITPPLRKRVEEQFQRGAINQSFLVESVFGVETLKAMAVEPRMRDRWDQNLAAFVKSSFRTRLLGAAGSQIVQLISKVTMIVVLWLGAKLVMAGELTLGQLVAFNMLAGQVGQPIIRIAQLWQDFQQFRISIERLGDILNVKPEADNAASALNVRKLAGHVTFENVTFRYRTEAPETLRDVSIDIRPGEMIGIVGRSGSGKSTITKLIQRLHVPERGRVLIDGTDIGLLDPAWLRRQIGVVLQDNVLFNRTVRENIAFAEPAMAMERVIRAAQLAGAHEFIQQLPQGYETVLEERGSNLSGGQRQRIAIARALAILPAILILDEATAALDYESEQLIQRNLKRVAKGRTVIIVAHRLSTVRDANRIFVMDRGKVVESGNHQALIKLNGLYAQLAQIDSGTG